MVRRRGVERGVLVRGGERGVSGLGGAFELGVGYGAWSEGDM